MDPRVLGQLLAPEPDRLEQQHDRVERVPALPGLAGRVRRLSRERDVHVLARQQDAVHHVPVGGVEEERRVEPIEEPVVQHELLAAAPFLGRGAQKDHLAGEGVPHGREGDRRAHARGRHRVVAAAVAEARQRVVFRQDADPRTVRAEPAAEPAANRGRQAPGRVLHGIAVSGDRFRDARGGAMLLEGGLGIGVDRVRQRQDLAAARRDGGGCAGLQLG